MEFIRDPYDINWVSLTNAELSFVFAAASYFTGDRDTAMQYNAVTGERFNLMARKIATAIAEYGEHNASKVIDGDVMTITEAVTGRCPIGGEPVDDCKGHDTP